MSDPKSPNQNSEKSPNKGPHQETPSRGYGEVAADGTHQNVEDASAAETTASPEQSDEQSHGQPKPTK